MLKFALGGVPMQISFHTDISAQEFSFKDHALFPKPPCRCPFKDCSMPVNLKKHGYYSRFFISKIFTGFIFLRRYICPVCCRTISMLPMFCLRGFQYSGIDILNLLHELYQGGISLRKLIERTKSELPTLERRHMNYYRKRIVKNRSLIQYGLNLISPEFIFAGGILENQKWVKTFLEKVQNLHPHVFLLGFSHCIGKPFMTS
jgi:transposase-like protein